jgi:hypothetical protein
MSSLFQGSPQTATSYTTSSTETPKWMQDAIYNQIQLAQNVANAPYQPYSLPTVAELSPLQQQAYQQVQANQGSWQPGMNFAQSGMQDFSSKGTADALRTAQGQVLRNDLINENLDAGRNYFSRAGQQDIMGAAQPYLSQAGTLSSIGAAQPYLGQSAQTTAEALSDRALSAANPYLQAASQSSAQGINQYMSPYQQNVMDVMAKQGARNLTENLLPGVSDAFIKAGQFGSSRMGEFGSRALRDTQESILNQQAQLANQGYGQALGASQADLARQAQLAGTVGSISGADLSRVLQGAGQYQNIAQTAGSLTGQQMSALTNLGQTSGQLTGQQMQNLASLGQMQTGAGQAQQQFGLSAAQAAQQAQAQDYARQMSALTNVANMAQQQQGMQAADVASLEGAGAAQQAQMQRQLTAAEQQYMNQQNYPKQQLDWLSTQVRGMAPITPQATTTSGTTTGATYSASPLSQLATGMYTYKGLQGLNP